MKAIGLAALLLAGGASVSAAQGAGVDPLARGLDLERRGNYVEAIAAYRTVLTARPGGTLMRYIAGEMPSGSRSGTRVRG